MNLKQYIALAGPDNTQEEWAERLGISRSLLSEILSGKRTMLRESTRVTIAKSTGYAVKWSEVCETDERKYE